jgi:hypothetical protein
MLDATWPILHLIVNNPEHFDNIYGLEITCQSKFSELIQMVGEKLSHRLLHLVLSVSSFEETTAVDWFVPLI